MRIYSRLGTLQKQFWGVLFISLLIFCNINTPAQQVDKTYRVLFVGNSYTYVNSLPQMFKAMVESQSPDYDVEVKFIGGGGATLKKHWQMGEASRAIKSGHWDYVILQGQSMFGSDDLADPDSPEQFYKYARKLDAEIKKNDAKTVFFMTWPRKHLQDQQKYLTTAYRKIAKESGSMIAPVGLVWEKFREISKINLYRRDGSHPSIAGTYLCALTLFDTIFKTLPENLPVALYGHKILRGGKLSSDEKCLCDLSIALVNLLRRAVVEVLPGK
ncbi:MAG TPA: SGNH/GDSL hydrolase family protein [Ignavibacteriaceae bacterium]|nr:SGNH/GDSL hydrolase family protein [Ignavibacteriaceae bacterium]